MCEQGEKPVGGPVPARSGLGEVLQAGEHDEALASSFGDCGGKVGQGGDVGYLVESEKHRRGRVAPVGGCRCRPGGLRQRGRAGIAPAD